MEIRIIPFTLAAQRPPICVYLPLAGLRPLRLKKIAKHTEDNAEIAGMIIIREKI